MVVNETINQTIVNATAAIVPAADPNLIGLPAIVVILIISVLVSILSNLAYKYATDQAMIKQVREDIKKHQESLKAQTDPQKKLEIQSQITSLSMKLMPQTFKPMLVTIVPFLIIFTFKISQVVSWTNRSLKYLFNFANLVF